MTASFNLIDQPWIPCIDLNGGVQDYSIQGVFENAQNLLDIAPSSPLEKVAIYRYLLAILHRVYGPKNVQAWAELWRAETLDSDALRDYLESRYNCFDLFHPERPFMQFTDTRYKPKGDVHGLAYGTGFHPKKWYCHELLATSSSLTFPQATRGFLSVLTFGFGGLSGLKNVSHEDSACTKGMTFLIQSESLKRSLLLNLNKYELDLDSFEPDLPNWEVKDAFELSSKRTSNGLLDQLTYPVRKINLFVDPGKTVVNNYQMGIGLGFDADSDPMKWYRIDKKRGAIPCVFDQQKSMFHHIHSLLTIDKVDNLPPAIFAWLATLVRQEVLSSTDTLHCAALGVSKNKGRNDFVREEKFSFSSKLLTSEVHHRILVDATEYMEKAEFVLKKTCVMFALHTHIANAGQYSWKIFSIKGNSNEQVSKANSDTCLEWVQASGFKRLFWSTHDVPFLRFIDSLGNTDEADLNILRNDWEKQVRDLTTHVFEKIIHTSASKVRTKKAYALASRYFYGALNNI